MAPPSANKAKKKAKVYNARIIRAEISDPSFDKDRRLNIPDFLQSREYEIRSFEQAQLKSKASRATRVFQNLPRVLRRRTASHNVKRVPKRMRNRAIQEMLAAIAGSKNKYYPRGRQLYRLKLRKRLLKLGSKLKLLKCLPVASPARGRKLKLRKQLADLDREIAAVNELRNKTTKVDNCTGAYDNSQAGALAPKPRGYVRYAHRQKKFIWIPTHIWHAKRFHMIKQFGYQIPVTPLQKCYRATHRWGKHQTIAVDSSYFDVMVIDADPANFFKEHISVPASPALISGRRSYYGPIIVDGITVTYGLILANDSRMVLRVHPLVYERLFYDLKPKYEVQDCRYAIGGIELMGAKSLIDLSKVVHIVGNHDIWRQISRMEDHGAIASGSTFVFSMRDPRMWKHPVMMPQAIDADIDSIIRVNTENHTASLALLTAQGRTDSYVDQLSVAQLGQEFKQAGPFSNSVREDVISSSNIPIIVTKTPDSWTVLLPWHWVLPLWISLMRVPDVHPGGYNQIHQLNFEQGRASFPQDYPWLAVGWEQQQLRGTLRERNYACREKKYRQDSHEDYLDCKFMSPFMCSWTLLRSLVLLKRFYKLTPRILALALDEVPEYDDDGNRVIKTYADLRLAVKQVNQGSKMIPITADSTNIPEISTVGQISLTKLPVRAIYLKCSSSGKLDEGAKIYPNDSRQLEDIVGFVTTGNFNLEQGAGLGIGYVSTDTDISNLIVRNLGCTQFHPVVASYL